MLGYLRTSNTSQTGLGSLYLSPSFLSKNQLAKEGQIVWLQWSYQPWPHLWISHSRVTGHYVQLEPCATTWTGLQILGNKELFFVSFKKGFDKDISPATISPWIKQTVILYYELSDQEALTLHRVKAHDVRALSASKTFQSRVSREQFFVSLPP